jgi:protein-S-isoprenylcysteine O-methyltransferase Ste14
MNTSQNVFPSESAKNLKPWVRVANTCIQYMIYDLLGGPKLIKANTIIRIQGYTQCLFGLWALIYVQSLSAPIIAMFVMLFAHEIMWQMKIQFFPDRSWEKKATPSSIVVWIFYLLALWTLPFYLILGVVHPEYPLPTTYWTILCGTLFCLGLILNVASDAHKNLILLDRDGLISNGLFGLVRQPNYLGQILMYVAMLLLDLHWVPTLAFGIFLFIAIVNIQVKEASIKRHKGWADYSRNTKMIIPWIF